METPCLSYRITRFPTTLLSSGVSLVLAAQMEVPNPFRHPTRSSILVGIFIGFSSIHHSFTYFWVQVVSLTEPSSFRLPDPSHLSAAKAERSCGILWATSVGTASSNASRSSLELPGERHICGRPIFLPPSTSILSILII